jgi:hypothetical protein
MKLVRQLGRGVDVIDLEIADRPASNTLAAKYPDGFVATAAHPCSLVFAHALAGHDAPPAAWS